MLRGERNVSRKAEVKALPGVLKPLNILSCSKRNNDRHHLIPSDSRMLNNFI